MRRREWVEKICLRTEMDDINEMLEEEMQIKFERWQLNGGTYS